MVQPRPSCMLVLDIDENLATEQTRLEVGRCYPYVGSAIVRTHPAQEGGAGNVMRLHAKLGNRHYLRSTDEGADELWESTIARWFYNQFHTVCNNMRIYNRRQREIGNDELRFDWLECDMENGALRVALRLDSTCSVPPEQATLLTEVRCLLNDGTLGDGVVRVSMPTQRSWEEQVQAGLAAKEERLAQEEAQREAEREAEIEQRAAAEAQAEEDFLESPELAAQATQEADAQGREPEGEGADEFDPFEEEVPDFAVDYRMWDVEYADGRVRVFDSAERRFTDEEAAR